MGLISRSVVFPEYCSCLHSSNIIFSCDSFSNKKPHNKAGDRHGRPWRPVQKDAQSPVFVKNRQCKAKELIYLSHLLVSCNVQEILLCGTYLWGIFKVFQYFQNSCI